MFRWAHAACVSGITHERQPIFRHRKKKDRKTERGEFITPPRPTGRRSKKPSISIRPRLKENKEIYWSIDISIYAMANSRKQIQNNGSFFFVFVNLWAKAILCYFAYASHLLRFEIRSLLITVRKNYCKSFICKWSKTFINLFLFINTPYLFKLIYL